ncbi:MAG: ATP-binding protein [Candidatus Marinimicrobia bacterium]|nr:ATP-binding protein [Candidatus Neomarinimicrobiota bacterium]|tara:strand:+ start:802 stop:1227 length:426 start_codon:yes stop_codon:yes gene_type:complete
MPTQLSLSIPNNRPEIRKLRNIFDEFSQKNQISENIRRDVQLALDELVTNIIDYGYNDSVEHTIEFGFNLSEDCLTIEIVDDAAEYDILEKEDPDTTKSIDEKPIGGLGIFLVKHLMTDVKYKRTDGKNRVTLIKELTQGD